MPSRQVSTLIVLGSGVLCEVHKGLTAVRYRKILRLSGRPQSDAPLLTPFELPWPSRRPHCGDAHAHSAPGQAALHPALLCGGGHRQDGRGEGQCRRILREGGADAAWLNAALHVQQLYLWRLLRLCAQAPGVQAVVRRIPRSREVGQSYFTSVWTTFVALCAAFSIVFSHRPELVGLNPFCNLPDAGTSSETDVT